MLTAAETDYYFQNLKGKQILGAEVAEYVIQFFQIEVKKWDHFSIHKLHIIAYVYIYMVWTCYYCELQYYQHGWLI